MAAPLGQVYHLRKNVEIICKKQFCYLTEVAWGVFANIVLLLFA
jgi:hypothetical protein